MSIMDTKISVNESAYQLNISPQSVKRWISEGKLQGIKVKGKWFVVPDDQYEYHLGHNLDTNRHHSNTENLLHKERISKLEIQIETKDRQIESLSQQMDRLSQLLAVSHKSLQQVSEQYQLLTDNRKRPFWKRIFGL